MKTSYGISNLTLSISFLCFSRLFALSNVSGINGVIDLCTMEVHETLCQMRLLRYLAAISLALQEKSGKVSHGLRIWSDIEPL